MTTNLFPEVEALKHYTMDQLLELYAKVQQCVVANTAVLKRNYSNTAPDYLAYDRKYKSLQIAQKSLFKKQRVLKTKSRDAW